MMTDIERRKVFWLLRKYNSYTATAARPYSDKEIDPAMPVTWRLIWKDERYLDGQIPAEEAECLAPLQEDGPVRLGC